MRSCGHEGGREGGRPRREGGFKTGPASFSPSFFSPAWDLTSGGKMVALMSSRRNTSVIACQCQAQGGGAQGGGAQQQNNTRRR